MPPAAPNNPSHPSPCGRSTRAERLGMIRARDEAEAIDKAMAEFKLKPWQASPGVLKSKDVKRQDVRASWQDGNLHLGRGCRAGR